MTQHLSDQWQQFDARLRADNEAAWFTATAWHMDAHLNAGDEREGEGA